MQAILHTRAYKSNIELEELLARKISTAPKEDPQLIEANLANSKMYCFRDK